jgi:hypothetical protein
MRVFTADGMLRDLHRLSDGRHRLVDDPDSADLILLMVPDRVPEWSCVSKYRAKTFVISTRDLPLYTHQGVYTSAAGRTPRFGSRVRSGAYNLISEPYKNPFVKGAAPGTALRSSKKYLFSFIGRDCHPARTRILGMTYRRKDVLVRDSSNFNLWTPSAFDASGDQAGREFFQVLAASKFGLCPRGVSPNTIRLFECLKLGVVPVVISDGWLRPHGPDWDRFCIFVKESDVGRLEAIVEGYEDRHVEMGEEALRAHEEYFSDRAYFNFLVGSCADIARRRWLPENLGSAAIRTWIACNQKAAEVRGSVGLRTRLRRTRVRQPDAP